MDVAGLTGDVLVVNAGSTSLKLSVVGADDTSRWLPSLEDPPPVVAVGHRVVHGGERLTDPVLIDDDVVAELERLIELAPLHNAPAVDAIKTARRELPGLPHIAVFDTAFHRSLPEVARTYALSARFRERGIRRFGFHGLSVQWVAEHVVVPRLVVCHLGGGSSVTAVRDGRSVDTTMGFTPLEGVPMGTRAGSIDPGALLYLLRQGIELAELERALEHESGLTGLAGTDDLAQLERDPSPEAALAVDIYCYRVAQAVAAMTAALGGLDGLAFTGGIGENSELVRAKICARLGHLGTVAVHVVPAREDVVIARAARSLTQ
jgi:acetate kinase